MEHPISPRQRAPPPSNGSAPYRGQRGHRPGHQGHHPSDKWDNSRSRRGHRRRSRTPPSCGDSSRSSSGSRSDSDLGGHQRIDSHERNMDTLNSASTGDGIYSRINDTGELLVLIPFLWP